MRLDSEVLVPAFELLPVGGLTVDSPAELVVKLLFSLVNIDSEDFAVDGP